MIACLGHTGDEPVAQDAHEHRPIQLFNNIIIFAIVEKLFGKDQPQWPSERILAGMRATRPVRVAFTRPIRVLQYDVTAPVLPKDGGLRFAEDLYR